MSRVVILVEGESDAEAVRALAELTGVDLEERNIEVLASGGVTNFARVLRERPGEIVAGLYDRADERHVLRALDGIVLPGTDLEDVGFFACDVDLEDELIRASGVDAVLALLDRQDELRGFDILRQQPQHVDRSTDQQLRRFMGTRATRKIRYGRLLVEALDDPAQAPEPLRRVLLAALA